MSVKYKDKFGNIVNVPTSGSTTQVDTFPAASASNVGTIYQYVGTTTSNYIKGYFYVCVENSSTNPSTYSWENINVQSGNSGGQAIQVDTLPTASVDELGNIYQYVGENTVDLVNGFFYKCVEDDSTNPSTYDWVNVNVQSGGGSSGAAIDDATTSTTSTWSSNKINSAVNGAKATMTGATSYTNGVAGYAPAPAAGDNQKVLFGDGQWHNIYTSASGSTVMVVTTETTLKGQTVTLTDGYTTLTETMGQNGECFFTDVSLFGAITVTCESTQGETARASANITYFGTYTVPLTLNFATIQFTTTDTDLIGQTINLYHDNVLVGSTSFRLASGAITAEAYVEELGSYKAKVPLSAKGQAQGVVTVAALRQTYTMNLFLYHCYAYKVDKNDSNPATRVTPYESDYGCENLNYTPAHMDYQNDVFDYGSWTGLQTCDRSQVFFAPKPCMLNYNGSVAYYLDPSDFTKKADGVTASDIADETFGGNAMVQFPNIYFKRWEDSSYQYCVITDKQVDSGFKNYAHHDVNGATLPYIYLAMYFGSYDGLRMRSLSGKEPMTGTTRQQEFDRAQANNDSGEQGEGWFTMHKADWDMVNDLLILIGMSTDTQTTFGRGNDSRGINGCIGTGTMDNKGLFWGSNDGTSGVKVFIENWWGNIWRSIAGWINANGTQKVKMTYGQEDGSTTDGFNLDGTGYVAISNSTPNGGYINTYYATEYGMIPKNANGSATTYLCDGMWDNNSQIDFALVGGCSDDGAPCGAFCACLNGSAADATWFFGASLTYKGIVTT